jgi:hypothetical protein
MTATIAKASYVIQVKRSSRPEHQVEGIKVSVFAMDFNVTASDEQAAWDLSIPMVRNFLVTPGTYSVTLKSGRKLLRSSLITVPRK